MKKLLIGFLIRTLNQMGLDQVLYGLGKVHKETRREFPPFHPIFSATDTPTFELLKFFYHF